jgi:hypothetical protein
VAERFGDLDPAIDMRADDAGAGTPFIGFHRLEQALWQEGRLDGLGPVADQLVADTQRLQSLVNDPARFRFDAAQMANGSSELLAEVVKSKLTGEEERYSRLDLLDITANVDGARRAFLLLQPGLGRLDPALAETLQARFADWDAAVAPLAEALRRTNAYDRVNIAAFSDRRLLQLRRAAGRPVCTSMGPAAIARMRMAAYGVPVGPFAAACVQVPTTYRNRTLVDARFVNAATCRGIPVHVWTIDEPAEIHRLLDLGVGGIMTDRPSVLKQVMEERGQWVS